MKIKFPGFPTDEKTYYTLTDTSSPEHQAYVGMKFLPDRKPEVGSFIDFNAKDGVSTFPLFIKELTIGEAAETIEIRNIKGYFKFRKSTP